MKLPKEEAIEILFGLKGQKFLDDSLIIVESLEWVSDGKYELGSVVFKNKEGQFFQIHDNRTGSYYTDYYFGHEDWSDEVEADEVVPVQKTITEYVAKK